MGWPRAQSAQAANSQLTMISFSSASKMSFTALQIFVLIALVTVGQSTSDRHPTKVRYNRKVMQPNRGGLDPSAKYRLVRKLSGASRKRGFKKVSGVRKLPTVVRMKKDYYKLYQELIKREELRKKREEDRKKRRERIKKLRKLRALRKKQRIARRKKLLKLRKARHLKRLLFLLKKKGYKYPSKVRYPEACSCKVLPANSNSVCYSITNPRTGLCRRRPCQNKYVCVPGINTGLTCYRRFTKTKVFLTSSNYCKVKKHRSIMYVPYA